MCVLRLAGTCNLAQTCTAAVKCAVLLRRLAGTCPSLGLRRLLFGIGRFGSAFGSCPTGEGASRCGTAFLRGEQGDVAKGGIVAESLGHGPNVLQSCRVPMPCKVAVIWAASEIQALLRYLVGSGL